MKKLFSILALALSFALNAQTATVPTQSAFEQLEDGLNGLAHKVQELSGNQLYLQSQVDSLQSQNAALWAKLDSLITALKDSSQPTPPPPPVGKVVKVYNAQELKAAVRSEVAPLHIKLMGGIFDFRPYEALQVNKQVILDGSEGKQASYLFGAQLILREGAKGSTIKHLNIYVGDGSPENQISERDAFKNKADNVTFENCTFGFGVDETGQNLGANVKFIKCLLHYPLSSPLHKKGPHPKGLLLSHHEGQQGSNVLLDQCAFLGCLDRNPQFNPGVTGTLANSYVYQCKFGPGFSTNRGLNYPPLLASASNIVVENCWKTPFRVVFFNPDFAGEASIYAKDWLIDGEYWQTPWDGGAWLRKIYGHYEATNPPMPLPELLPLNEVKEKVLDEVGARPELRDELVLSSINAALNGTKIPILTTAKDHWPKPIN